MSNPHNSRISEQLSKHTASELDDAVQRVRAARDDPRADEFPVDRTTPKRWRSGAHHPQRRMWIEALADELGNPRLPEAWDHDAAVKSAARSGEYIRTLAERLSDEELRELLQHVRLKIRRTEFTTRERFDLKIRLRPLSPPLLRGDVEVSWHGDVPANANVRIAADPKGLAEAFTDRNCIYRDLIGLSEEQFVNGFSLLRAANPEISLVELCYQTNGTRWTTLAASSEEPGVFRFDNKRIDAAELRLTVRFPFPVWVPLYVVRFGSYAVRGPARISLSLEGGVPFDELQCLPPADDGCEVREVHDRDRVSIDLSCADELLPAAPTIVFYWGVVASD